MLSYKLRNMPIFIMIAILLMACGNAAITQPQPEATPQPEITPSPATAGLIDGEETPAVEKQKEENLTQTPTVDVDESEEETSTSPLPTSAATGGVMAEENVISTVVTTTTATPPTNTTAITATPVFTAGSEGWRAENIEAEGVVALDLSATLSAQSAQENGKYFLNPAISPDGRYLLIERSTLDSIPCYEGSDCLFSIGELWLYDFTLNQWEILVTAAIKGTWSPDGQQIAYLAQVGPGEHELQYLSLADRTTHTVTTDATRSQLYWRDNQHLVYLGPGGYVTQIKVDGSSKQQLSSIQTNGEAVDFALSDNGASLAIVDNRDLWLVDLETSQEPLLLSPEEEHLRYSGIVQGLAWSSDGQYLAFASGQYYISVYDKTGRLISNFGAGDPPHSLIWSPDNRSIAALGDIRDNEGQLESYVTVTNLDGTNSQVLNVSDDIIKFTLDWSADGSYMVWGADSVEGIDPPQRLNLKLH